MAKTPVLRSILGGKGGEPPDMPPFSGGEPSFDEQLDAELARDSKGKVAPIPANVGIILSKSEDWQMHFDEFRGICIVERAPPTVGHPARAGELDEYHALTAQHWLTENFKVEFALGAVRAGMIFAGKQRWCDPLKSYLRGLEWDGVGRVETWLTRYLGAAPDALTNAMGRMWLISGAARGLSPGCKVDHMLVLLGAQGDRKSTALSSLCPN